MSGARYIVGDVFDGLAQLEREGVQADVAVSSPPFLALRSYLPADHPDKAKEIGSEATPGEFLDVLLDVVEACARVLAPHGSLVFELGDTYSGAGGENHLWDNGYSGFSYGRNTKKPEGQGIKRGAAGWPLDKSKVLIPQLFAIALAYGFNPLTGRTTEPWRVRNTVAWCRPNPPVGRDGDKFRPATSFLTVACKSRDRYWDGDAVRVPYKPGQTGRAAQFNPKSRTEMAENHENPRDLERVGSMYDGPGAPLLDYWEIPTEPYAGAHYATFPRALVVPVVKSMCPQKVCRVCGRRPSTRIVAPSERYAARESAGKDFRGTDPTDAHAKTQFGAYAWPKGLNGAEYETLGWSDCGCPVAVTSTNIDFGPSNEGTNTFGKWRPGLVLDPFAGSGTTLQVATGHGRDAIGIDLDSRNAELAYERIGGLFLTIEHLPADDTRGIQVAEV